VVDEDLIDREVAFAQTKILLAPQNQSPWNYLRGLYRKSGRPMVDLRDFAQQFAGDDGEGDVDEGVRSSHALDLLADIYAEEGEVRRARRTLEALGRRWDPVRKGYWDYRAGLLKETEEEGEEGRGNGNERLSVA
jgi:protein farnesyltransferase/geranylgeranyltransferase type-1 subunit alpha